jgi:hypothetical protein
MAARPPLGSICCMNRTRPISTTTERPVPRWASIAAHLVPLVVLPAGLWRLALASGLSLGMLEDGVPVHVHGGERISVVGLTVVSEAAALLTFALVRPWGERVPAWVPWLGERRVPPRAVILPAAIGAALLLWAPLLAALTVGYHRRRTIPRPRTRAA